MRRDGKCWLVGGGIVALLFMALAYFYSLSDISHQAINFICGHEYHSKTGRWPSRVADLAEILTSAGY
jgi:hypothetical protein